MSVRILFEKNTYLNDVQEIPRAFVPYFDISDDGENYLSWTYKREGNVFTFTIDSDLFGRTEFSHEFDEKEEIIYKKRTKYFAKNALYSYLSKALNISLPYGSLTGVRPTRMYRELSKTSPDPKQELIENFSVKESKAEVIERCALFQDKYINRDENAVGVYINIPFCPSRCSYCSFISTEVFRVKKELPAFVACVKKDIETIFGIIEKKGFSIRSVYVGGGTPTSIGEEYLNDILSPLKNVGTEFTVECGRPDTITEGMLDMLTKNNVTRISINPQSFHQKTLDLIGRKHTVEDIYRAYEMAKKRNFDINFDLIAALPGENFEDFSFSLKKAIELGPQNITVHTLSIKRGSSLNRDGASKKASGEALGMTDFSYRSLSSAGYSPYYMYRQKNTADNLENTGFCKDEKVCLYNVDTMEESASIISAGAGAVSKLLGDGGKITRFSHPKGFREYIERSEESNKALKEFFLGD